MRLGIQPIKLELEGLLQAAREKTGLSDFGDDHFREGLSRLLESLENEAELSMMGRLIVRADLGHHLEIRLQLMDWIRRHPEIEDEEIVRPIVICGQGRTGTTILHELMALDPRNRVPLTWECDAPFPPPERATYLSDPRIAIAEAKSGQADRLIPGFSKIHRSGPTLPQECVRITGGEFSSLIFSIQWRVPSYTRWLINEADMSYPYRYHRLMLKYLQWRCPGERWVLKSPGHLYTLEELVTILPDARLVQTHRDPLKILSSLTSLGVVLRSMASTSIDSDDIAREWSEWNCAGYEESVDFRESGKLPTSQIVDIQFDDFVADSVAQARRIYEAFDIEFSSELEARMRAYVDRNPSDRDGKHTHRFEDTGLDADEERAKVTRYQEFFGVRSEI